MRRCANAVVRAAVKPRTQGNERRRSSHGILAEAEVRKADQVSRVTPQVRHLAGRLVAQGAQANRSLKAESMSFHAWETLRVQLGILMGTAGCVSLVARAVALASHKAPRLRDLRVNSDGSMEMTGGSATSVSTDAIAAAEVAVLTELLGLLVAFIGEALTVQMLHEAWPKMALHELDFSRRIEQ